jgi:hypothetical protein
LREKDKIIKGDKQLVFLKGLRSCLKVHRQLTQLTNLSYRCFAGWNREDILLPVQQFGNERKEIFKLKDVVAHTLIIKIEHGQNRQSGEFRQWVDRKRQGTTTFPQKHG